MATTGYSSTGAYLDTGYGIARIHADIVYNVTRTNNTVYFSNTYTRIKYVRESGSWTSFNYPNGWTMRLYVPSSSQRTSNTGSGTRSVNQVNDGTKVSFSVAVGMNDTVMAARVGAWFSGDSQTYANKTLDIPNLGAPAGTTSVDGTTHNSITVRNNVTSWGAHATADKTNIDIATNSSFTGFWGASVSDNVAHTFTGLTSNTEYWMRGWQRNGGGKSAYSNTVTAVTLPRSTITSTDFQSTTAQFTGTATTGKYTPSTKIQYREIGTSSWTDSAAQTGGSFNISVSDLSPSIEYEYRLATTTTAGTWYGSVTAFNTLPAAKLIMPDGTTVNAVPYTIDPSGEKKMLNIKVIQP